MAIKTIEAKRIETLLSGYIGNVGEVFYDVTGTQLYISDGVTPGGIPVTGTLDTNVITSANTLAIITNATTQSITIDLNSNVGINQTTPQAGLHLPVGTVNVPTMIVPAGSLLTNVVAGAIENDGNVRYATTDTVSGRGYEPTVNVLRMQADGSASSSGDFFGSSSDITLMANSVYKFEYSIWLTKQTPGNVVFTLESSEAPNNIAAQLMGSNTATGEVSIATGIVGGNTTSVDLPAIGLDPVLACYKLFGIYETNSSNNSTFNLSFNVTIGTITPLRGSYLEITKLPSSGTVGIFT